MNINTDYIPPSFTTDQSSTPIQGDSPQTDDPLQAELMALQKQLEKDSTPPNVDAIKKDIENIKEFLSKNQAAIIAEVEKAGWIDQPGRPPVIRPTGFSPNPFGLLYGTTGSDLNNGSIFTSGNNYDSHPNPASEMQLNEDLTSLLSDMQRGPN